MGGQRARRIKLLGCVARPLQLLLARPQIIKQLIETRLVTFRFRPGAEISVEALAPDRGRPRRVGSHDLIVEPDREQNIVSRQFQRVLREARGFNMSVTLSHQSLYPSGEAFNYPQA